MQIETMRYHCSLKRMYKVQNIDNTKCIKDAEQKINKNKGNQRKSFFEWKVSVFFQN